VVVLADKLVKVISRFKFHNMKNSNNLLPKLKAKIQKQAQIITVLQNSKAIYLQSQRSQSKSKNTHLNSLLEENSSLKMSLKNEIL